MFDMTGYLNESLEIKYIDGSILHILTPTLYSSYKIRAIANSTEPDSDRLIEITHIILNHNLENRKISLEEIKNKFPEKLMADFYDKFNDWLQEEAGKKN